ncbi:hypothetical protein ACJX0J_025246, partial [Zea mays]
AGIRNIVTLKIVVTPFYKKESISYLNIVTHVGDTKTILCSSMATFMQLP